MTNQVVRARCVDDIDEERAPGSFEFYKSDLHDPAGIIYVCPCGCGREGVLRFRLEGQGRPSWIWDGNRESPTLTPSVHDIISYSAGGQKTHWHGWLRNGQWVPC